MHRRFLFVFACLLFTNAATRAQSLPSAQPAPARASADTPAQNSPSDQSSSEKKVWTNEDLSGSSSAASTVPNRPRPTLRAVRRTAPATRNANANPNANAKWYYNQIAMLQAKLPPLDAQIASLQSAIDGKAAGDAKTSTRPFYGVRADDWSRELAELQQKRAGTLAQIGALEDQARHAGVPSSALP